MYVCSVNTGAVERSPGFLFHTCDLKRAQSVTFYAEEDKKAIEFLNEKDVRFELIDLSKCSFAARLKAKTNGINKTPTLVLDDGLILKGIEQIQNWFNK